MAFSASTGPDTPVQDRIGVDFWFRTDPQITAAVYRLGNAAAETITGLAPEAILQLDYACARDAIIPTYLGGASGLAAMR